MKLTQAAAAAVISLASTGAWAAGGPLDLSSGSTGFSSTPMAGSFTELWTFTLTSPSWVWSSITAVSGGGQDVDLTAIRIAGTTSSASFVQLLPDPIETWGLVATILNAGSYTLSVSGTNTAAMGSYAGNIAVTAVPEPETYLLLAAGLLAVGMRLRGHRG